MDPEISLLLLLMTLYQGHRLRNLMLALWVAPAGVYMTT